MARRSAVRTRSRDGCEAPTGPGNAASVRSAVAVKWRPRHRVRLARAHSPMEVGSFTPRRHGRAAGGRSMLVLRVEERRHAELAPVDELPLPGAELVGEERVQGQADRLGLVAEEVVRMRLGARRLVVLVDRGAEAGWPREQ